MTWNPSEAANRVIAILYVNAKYEPQDWNTDGTKSIGEWKRAVEVMVQELKTQYQQVMDAEVAGLEARYTRTRATKRQVVE
jgi:hypothetical protein